MSEWDRERNKYTPVVVAIASSNNNELFSDAMAIKTRRAERIAYNHVKISMKIFEKKNERNVDERKFR